MYLPKYLTSCQRFEFFRTEKFKFLAGSQIFWEIYLSAIMFLGKYAFIVQSRNSAKVTNIHVPKLRFRKNDVFKLLQKLLMQMKKLLSTKNYFKKCFHAYIAFLAEMYSFLGLVLSWENWMTPSEYNDVLTVPIFKQNYIIHYNQSVKWICKRRHTYSIMEWNITWINNWRCVELFYLHSHRMPKSCLTLWVSWKCCKVA